MGELCKSLFVGIQPATSPARCNCTAPPTLADDENPLRTKKQICLGAVDKQKHTNETYVACERVVPTKEPW
jgi:hypothetical protein